jgi:hypothetical protein
MPDPFIALARALPDQRKMVAHQAVGVNLSRRLAAGLAQAGQKQMAVARTAKDGFPGVPTAHHMVDRAGKFPPASGGG